MGQKLSRNERLEIIQEEMRLGREVWKDINVTVKGSTVSVKTCKKWGAISINDTVIVLDNYPCHEDEKEAYVLQ